ncbi:MAG: hypothetical protein IVW52_17925 [Acidimicrobiales bacterium]|nr:hypothetical protein [Acidimicrobiales bacterium]
MNHKRLVATIAAGVLGAAGIGTGLAFAAGGGSSVSASHAYYNSEMSPSGNYSMANHQAYRWITGGSAAPGWERGSDLPTFMMGWTGDHPGEYVGSLFANAPGPRATPSQALQLGGDVPSGASLDAPANRITFSGRSVRFAVVASPSMPAENFRIAGRTDPTIVVPAGATVSIEVANADTDMAHGLVVTASGAASTWMPLMTAKPAFSGSALWFLGEANAAGLHTATLAFTASPPGTYQYLCPVPGHAQEGMAGNFVVVAGS